MTVKERSPKNILINPPFQIKLISYFIGLAVLMTASLYSTTFLFFWNLKKKALGVGIPEGHVFYHFLSNQKQDLDYLFIGLAIFNVLLLIVVGFIISHRIAGPLFKIQKHLESNSDEELKFRSNDFFQELAPLINKIRNKQ